MNVKALINGSTNSFMCQTLNVQIILGQYLWTFVDSFTGAVEYTTYKTTTVTR